MHHDRIGEQYWCFKSPRPLRLRVLCVHLATLASANSLLILVSALTLARVARSNAEAAETQRLRGDSVYQKETCDSNHSEQHG